jgi:hypothetical protein
MGSYMTKETDDRIAKFERKLLVSNDLPPRFFCQSCDFVIVRPMICANCS